MGQHGGRCRSLSLREALENSSDGSHVTFDESLDGGTILLTLGELSITKSMTVDASSLRGGLTLDASANDPTPDKDNGDGSRIFDIDDGDFGTDSEVTVGGGIGRSTWTSSKVRPMAPSNGSKRY